MILINILLVLLIFLILSDLYIKKSPKSKLNLVPINYKIKKKDGLNELIINLKISNKSNFVCYQRNWQRAKKYSHCWRQNFYRYYCWE